MKNNVKYWKNLAAIAGIAVGLAIQASAQEIPMPELIKDIVSGTGNSNPAEFVSISGQTFFVATTAAEGRELWKTDGTPEGTVLVKDIYPGTTGSSPSDLTAVGETLFFVANDGLYGRELWKSDGTSGGTVLVKDFWTVGNPGGPAPSELTNFNGVLFLSAATWDTGQELWKSDGTTTQIVSDYLPGGTNSFPSQLTVVNNTLFYSALPAAFDGPELFKSDGNTVSAVKDIYPGTTGSSPSDLTAVGGTLFFVANDGIYGRELWKSDGTSGGTVLVKDFWTVGNPGGPAPSELTNFNGVLFLSAATWDTGQELWKSDGTTTQIVSDYLPGGTNSFPSQLTVVNNTLFYSALPAAFDGPELFKSDGNTVSVVKDIYPGTTGSLPSDLTAVGGTLFFVANDGLYGRELWKSDGTSGGTVLVEDIYSGISASSPANLTSAMGTLFFSADDGITGREPWKLGTTLLTPVDLIENLIEQVLSLNLPNQIENGLIGKLNEALKVLTDDNQNNDHVAINKLEDFINQVNGQRRKRISEGDADALVAAAEEIILLLRG